MFYDRLVDNKDREFFFNIVKERTSGIFKESMDVVMDFLLFLRKKYLRKVLRNVLNVIEL